MPRQPDEPGKAAFAPKGVKVADAFARFSDTLNRAATRGNPASAKKRMADQRVQEALGAFGAAIGQAVETRPTATHAGKTIGPDRVMEAGRRVIAFACPTPTPCGGAG